MPFLQIQDEGAPITDVELRELAVIGRMPDCAIQLREPHASRRHAEVYCVGSDWFIRDLETRNGTRVNGKEISDCRLIPGDVISIGKATLTFWAEKPGHDTLVDRFGDYRVIEEIAHSSFARICRVRKDGNARDLALKVFDRKAFGDRIDVMFSTLQTLKTINHPAIATILDVCPSGDKPYFVSEYAPGQSLADILAVETRLPVDRANSIITRLAGGLAVVHSRGLVHGNLKPRNIIIGPAGDVKIVDFAGTCVTEQAGPGKLPTFAGVPYYLAPEQIQGWPADQRTDIYALGAVFFSMLAGSPLFAGRGDTETLQAHLHEAPECLRKLSQAPPRICKIIERMLAKDPANRFQSMQEVLSALNESPAQAAPADAPEIVHEPAAREPEGSSVLAFISGILLIVLLLAMFFGARDIGRWARQVSGKISAWIE